MSNVAINPAGAPQSDGAHAGHNHDPHLAHHFDTPEQQYISAKLGMWIFLGTEILMFGGLFCAYSVYRHNHPDVFEFAHQFLNKWLGAVNTLVLITSSLTMAWAVRSSQLGDSKSLRWLLAVTIIGGYVFLGIKSVEYHAKWEEVIFIGSNNQFRAHYKGPSPIIDEEQKAANEREIASRQGYSITKTGELAKPAETPKTAETPKPGETAKPDAPKTPALAPGSIRVSDVVSLAPIDPNAGGTDAAQIHPPFVVPAGLAPKVIEEHRSELEYRDLTSRDQNQIYTFFAVYFVMTGLHGIHVLVGMALITWVLLRAMGPKNIPWAVPLIPGSAGIFLAVVGIIIGGGMGTKLIVVGLAIAVICVIWMLIWVPMRRNRNGDSEFGPTYFTPVDLVGLYWHLVDLIWIFLFPLLYLIH